MAASKGLSAYIDSKAVTPCTVLTSVLICTTVVCTKPVPSVTVVTIASGGKQRVYPTTSTPKHTCRGKQLKHLYHPRAPHLCVYAEPSPGRSLCLLSSLQAAESNSLFAYIDSKTVTTCRDTCRRKQLKHQCRVISSSLCSYAESPFGRSLCPLSAVTIASCKKQGLIPLYRLAYCETVKNDMSKNAFAFFATPSRLHL